jgi:aryl-alcohol dehydrogenase-like predicted oxidoreductase
VTNSVFASCGNPPQPKTTYMALKPKALEIDMDFDTIANTPLRVSRVGLRAWAIGGWMWRGTDETQSIATIRRAVGYGINVIDTAPAHGFGRSEEIVGKALAEGNLRSKVYIATKAGLEWRNGEVVRNPTRQRILAEIEDSLRRLQMDDIYQIHRPAPLVDATETAEAMYGLYREGKIRSIGVSIFSVEQMQRFDPIGPEFMAPPAHSTNGGQKTKRRLAAKRA